MCERTDLLQRDEICPDLAIAILAGGKSSRFGADKALASLWPGGPTLLERTLGSVHGLSDLIAVVGHERYANELPGVTVLQDDEPGLGPLGGIATAMRHLDRDRLLILACDMPCLSRPLLRWMVERQTNAEVVIPRTDEGRWHPMHAIYRRSAATVVDRSLRDGDTAVRSILSKLTVDAIAERDLRRFDPELQSLLSVNRPEDLERAIRCSRCK